MDENTKLIRKGFLWFIFWTVIIFITSWFFVVISSFTGFTEETFLWLTSTIAQAFGAILGIFFACAILLQTRLDTILHKANKSIGIWPILYLPAQCMLVLIASAIICLTLVDFFTSVWIAIASIYLMFYSLLCLGLLIYRIPKFFS